VQNNLEQPQQPVIPANAPHDGGGADLTESEFLKALRGVFLATTRVWPKKVNDRAKVLAEMQAAFRWMFQAAEMPSVKRPAGAKGSAVQLIADVAKQTKWPKSPGQKGPALGKGWENHNKAFRRYEVGAAMNILMNAYNNGGSTGQGTPWPPQHPV
jgi:hypothetical protein